MPPKTESQIKIEYEYVPTPKILRSKDYGLCMEYDVSLNLPLHQQDNLIQITVEAPDGYYIERTNYEEQKKESMKKLKKATFSFEPVFKMDEQMKILFAVDDMNTLRWIKVFSLILTIFLFIVICAKVFLSYILPVKIINYILGGLWVILLSTIFFLGSINFVARILFTGIWLPSVLVIISLIIYHIR